MWRRALLRRHRRPGGALAAAAIGVGGVRGEGGVWADAVDGEGPADAARLVRADRQHGPLALLHLVDGFLEQPAVGRDRLVGGAQVLLGAVLDAPLALDSPLVVD